MRVVALVVFAISVSCVPISSATQSIEGKYTASVLVNPESDLSKLTAQNLFVSVGESEFVAVQEIKSAQSAPLDVILVIDTSNSTGDGDIPNAALSQATQLIDSLAKSGLSLRYAAIRVASVPKLVHGFTSDPISSRSTRFSSGGGTALYDAFVLAGEMFQKEPASNRHIVLAFTDGEDNQSRKTRGEALESLARGLAMVYAIDTRVNRSPEFQTRGQSFLQSISEQTGGRVFSPGRKSKVAEVFAQLENELRQQLILTFTHSDNSHQLQPIRFKSTVEGIRLRAPRLIPSGPASFN